MRRQPATILVVAMLLAEARVGSARPAFGQPAERHDVQPLIGISYSSVLGASGRAAVTWGSRSVCTHAMSGPFVQAELGLGGGRVGAGGALLAWDGVLPAGAVAGQVFLLRSWAPSSSLPEHQTYVGAEIKMTVFYASVGLSGYQRLHGQHGASRGIFVGVGAGF